MQFLLPEILTSSWRTKNQKPNANSSSGLFEKSKLVEKIVLGGDGKRKRACEKLGAVFPAHITGEESVPALRLDLKGADKNHFNNTKYFL